MIKDDKYKMSGLECSSQCYSHTIKSVLNSLTTEYLFNRMLDKSMSHTQKYTIGDDATTVVVVFCRQSPQGFTDMSLQQNRYKNA